MMIPRQRYLLFFFVLAALLPAACHAQSPTSTRPAGLCTPAGTPAFWRSQGQPLQSPEFLANGRVTLRFCAPDATSVRVAGDWNANRPTGDLLTKDAHGVWSISIGPLKPDLYTYSFIVDGIKTIDPNNVHSANDAVRIASYFIVAGPGTESALYENRNVPHGEVSAIWYSSKYVSSPRRALVYTPPNYRNGTERYPVLYLLHGWGGDEIEWPQLGRMAQIMDNLLAAHKVVPMIVVMPNGHADRHATPNISPPPNIDELGPLPPSGYDITASITGIEKSVIHDLVPYVDQNFRTLRKSSSRAIAGLSMGGAQALFIGLRNPDLFAWVASFSGAVVSWPGAMIPARAPTKAEGTAPLIPRFRLNPEAIRKDIPGLNESINGKLRLLYLSCGLDDGLLTSNREFEAWLTENKIRFTREEVPGYAHVWSLWRRNLVDVAPLLFRPQSPSRPGR